MAFCSWQYGGPRMLRSWKAEDYKRGERPVLDELPVRLAYMDQHGQAESPCRPPLPEEPVEAILARAERGGSPPVAWLRLLAAQPEVLRAWSGFYWEIFDRGVLPPRLKHLARVRMAQLIGCPSWVPEDAPRLLELGIGARERRALEEGDPSPFDAREQAALAYAEELSYGNPVEESTFQRLAGACTEAEIVELSFAVASQSGVIRAYRWLEETRAFATAPLPRPDQSPVRRRAE